jgi:hypothetical protein
MASRGFIGCDRVDYASGEAIARRLAALLDNLADVFTGLVGDALRRRSRLAAH